MVMGRVIPRLGENMFPSLVVLLTVINFPISIAVHAGFYLMRTYAEEQLGRLPYRYLVLMLWMLALPAAGYIQWFLVTPRLLRRRGLAPRV
jgi:hypothetical protein